MDASTLAGALARAVLAAHAYRGPEIALALLRDALSVLSDEQVEAELRTAALLPRDVAIGLEHDDRELAAELEVES